MNQGHRLRYSFKICLCYSIKILNITTKKTKGFFAQSLIFITMNRKKLFNKRKEQFWFTYLIQSTLKRILFVLKLV